MLLNPMIGAQPHLFLEPLAAGNSAECSPPGLGVLSWLEQITLPATPVVAPSQSSGQGPPLLPNRLTLKPRDSVLRNSSSYFFLMFIYVREREREGGKERGKTQNQKQAPGSEL